MVNVVGEGSRDLGFQGELLEIFCGQGSEVSEGGALLLPGGQRVAGPGQEVPRHYQLHLHQLVRRACGVSTGTLFPRFHEWPGEALVSVSKRFLASHSVLSLRCQEKDGAECLRFIL